MENTQPTTGKFALKYGIITSVIGIAFSLMLHFMDMQYSQSTGVQIVSTLILVSLVIVAIYQFKKANDGYLELGQALKVGMGVAAIAAVITVIYLVLYINFIEVDYHDKLAEITRAKMIEANPDLSTQQQDQAIEMQRKFFWVTYPIILIFNIFIGFVVSLITGLIMKKTKSEM
ncbi:DUF4199 domain-containing protein [Galbibacter sp. PAP.153]|uniref:DUF4199 domain-containing protein n=1 Tax=Galbibacter sp. PAP.153 TaxID=3104623 RepID=UPI0030094913